MPTIQKRSLRVLLVALLVCVSGVAPALAQADPSSRTALRLLDYIAVDYSVAVEDGAIISEAEYAEMVEFAAAAKAQIAALPFAAGKPAVAAQAEALRQAIDRRAEPQVVASLSKALAADVLAAWPVPVVPERLPDPARGAAVYAESCASCHGATGQGDGPLAPGLDPAPIAFTDLSRARDRSLFALYQVVEQGLEGTAMMAFPELSADDRWAVSFHAGTLAYPEALVAEGKAIWEADATLRRRMGSLEALTQTTSAELAASLGEDKARAVIAYLRRHSEAAAGTGSGLLDVARQKLEQSAAAYEAGAHEEAKRLALSAYLDGFEPVEPSLAARDGDLMARIEAAMAELRARIDRRAPAAEVSEQVRAVTALFDEAEALLADGGASSLSTFLGALAILLREGVEALLIVIAMVAGLKKAGRADALPAVHGGWAAALVAGAGTWVAATWLVAISGAEREITEGFGSILAAAVLIWVGIWMHGKAQAGAWQAYVRAKLDAALSRKSLWFLFLLAFIVVYREVFETILFYAAMWNQGSRDAILAGAATGVAMLAVIAWAMLHYASKLPIATFFKWSSALIAILAVVLAGKGLSALQEAGLIDITPLAEAPRVVALGIYPTLQGIMAQLAVAVILLLGFWLSGRRAIAPHRMRPDR